MTDTSQSDSAPSVVESTPLADAPPATPIPASTEAPHDLDLPAGHPDQPKPSGSFLDNVEAEPQQKPPRSYRESEAEWFRSLPVETQAELLAVEQRRERDVHQKIREAQTAQQQVAEERAAQPQKQTRTARQVCGISIVHDAVGGADRRWVAACSAARDSALMSTAAWRRPSR
jgi:hypothetical protein